MSRWAIFLCLAVSFAIAAYLNGTFIGFLDKAFGTAMALTFHWLANRDRAFSKSLDRELD